MSEKNRPPQRIALVSGGIALGGSTTFLINFAGELVRRGVAVEVFSLDRDNPMAADFQKLNIPVLCLDHRRLIFEDRVQIILRELKRFQPTTVATTLGAASFEVLRYLPKGIFRIGMGQSDDPIVYDMMRHYTPWMDLTVMVSETMRQRAAAMPEFARVPVVSLPYGVPMHTNTSRAPANDSPLRILYIGRLAREQKRVHLFPQILKDLCASGLPFHWTIAGAGGDESFLRTELKSAAPHQTVSFVGAVAYADVPALLRQQDVFLLASDYEGLPLSLLEAMGCGLVPVVSDLASGIREVVDDTVGIRVPVDEVPGYARGIVHLHENRVELAAMSAAARLRVQKNYSVAAMTDRWLAALPAIPATIQPWADCWPITAPLTASGKFHFSLPMRWLRRVAARLRS